jgi:hypothetical protein
VKGNFLIGLALGVVLAANVAFAADDILQGPSPGPYAAAMEGPDYVPGVDAAGQPVPRADIGVEHTAIPDQVYVPLPNPGLNRTGRGRGGAQSGEGPVAVIDGKRLEGLINPQPCQVPAPVPPRRR